MLICDIDISRLMVYVKHLEEEKMRTNKIIGIRKLILGMNVGSRRVVSIGYNSTNRRGMHHNLLVLLHPKTKVSFRVKICKTSGLDNNSLKRVWHGEKVGLLHLLSVAEPTQVNVVMAGQVASGVVKRVTS